MKVVIPEAVERSLFEIALHIAQDNPTAADKVVASLESLCFALGDHPQRSVVVASVKGEPIRRVIEGRHLIFYSATRGVVHSRKIIHGARSPQSLLKDLDPS